MRFFIITNKDRKNIIIKNIIIQRNFISLPYQANQYRRMTIFISVSERDFFSKFLLFFLLLICTYRPLKAQQNFFAPSPVNEEELRTLLASTEKHYKQETESLASANKKDFIEIYETRWQHIKDKFDKKEIYTSADAQRYLDDIVKDIVNANPFLERKEFYCLFSRSGIANASYIGEGLILLNMGLFTRLQNESQAAFVLCHEISHFYLEHGEKSIARYITTLNSGEVQGQLRNIKHREYGKRKELENLVQSLTFGTRRHGRDHESEADSMAVELLRNTRYDISQILPTLALLDSVDMVKINMQLQLQNLFDSKEYPFQKKWIVKEDGLLGGHAVLVKDESIADSLKTHPDCKKRINFLGPLIKKYAGTAKSIETTGQSKFVELQNSFRYEIVEYAFTSNSYCESFYYTIQLLQAKPADGYLITQTGKILNSLYTAQKEHKLNKVVELPSPYYSADYNMLLQFIQNLYLEDYAFIGFNFLSKYESLLSQNKLYTETYNKSKQFTKQ